MEASRGQEIEPLLLWPAPWGKSASMQHFPGVVICTDGRIERSSMAKSLYLGVSGIVCVAALSLWGCTKPPVRESAQPWTFAVSGDSRNCGNIVMPAIAEGAKRDHA